ncbi:MAG: polysaccharide deacetylase family protein [Pseudonocardia sp.]|nr:polysaccharide deacetylase family protein [Pseudonocardia sp.]
MTEPTWTWPGGKCIAVVFNVCLEAWSDGKAPGINPMGNPLPPQAHDLMAVSWAAYGVQHGVQRLLGGLEGHGLHACVAVSGLIAQRSPEVVKRVAQGGHEIVGHGQAMDIVPALLSEEDERASIEACTTELRRASGTEVSGWLSPRATPSAATPRLLAEAGYTWYGDTLASDLPHIEHFGDRRIVAVPFGTDVNDMPFQKYGTPPSAMLEAFQQNLDAARRSGEMLIIDVTTHAHIFGRPRGAYFHEQIAAAASAADDVWVATRREIAEHALTTAR